MRVYITLWMCMASLVVAYLLPKPESPRALSSRLRVQSQRAHISSMRIASVAGLLLLISPAYAADKSPALYDTYASSYDTLDGGQAAEVLGINKLRAKAGRAANGDVLEVAVGTGLELDYLGQTKSLVGIDISADMLSEAQKKLPDTVPSKLMQMDAGAMEFPDDSFDTVQSTFSFCVFDEPDKVMREMTRVVKPGGQVLLLENSLSTFKPLELIQDLTEPIITPLSKNCRWNVNVPKIAEEAGLKLISKEEAQAGTVYFGVYTK